MTDDLLPDTFVPLVRRIDPAATLRRAWRLTGGISAQVTALELDAADGTCRKLVVRQHGPADRAANANIATDEFRLLALLHTAGIAAPAPVYVDAAGDALGSPCVVIDFVEGAPDFAPTDAIDLVTQYAEHLARIHAISGGAADVAFLPDRAARIAERLRNRPDTLDDSLEEGRIRDALDRVWPLTPRNPYVLLHGDYWPGNVLCLDGRIMAVIDWEDAARGDPLADLGSSRLEIFWAYGDDAMQAYTAHYLALTGADTAQLPYWDLVAALRPAGELSAWSTNAATDRRRRERHAIFRAQAFAAIDS